MDGCPNRNDVPQVQELLSNGPQHHVSPQPQPGGEAESRKNGCRHSAGRTRGQEDGRDGQEADVTSVQLPTASEVAGQTVRQCTWDHRHGQAGRDRHHQPWPRKERHPPPAALGTRSADGMMAAPGRIGVARTISPADGLELAGAEAPAKTSKVSQVSFPFNAN